MRLFFAIPVSQESQKAILEIQQRFSDFKDLMTWVRPEQVHITLRFLGNQPEEKLSAIVDYSEDIFTKILQFTLSDSVLKVFPNVKNPRVLLVDFEKGADEYLALQRRLDETLLKSGQVFKNPKVTPHLTVGRIKEKASDQDRQAIVEAVARTPWGFNKPIEVKKIHLIQSQLTPKGPVYTMLESFLLVNA